MQVVETEDDIIINYDLWPRQYDAFTSEATEILYGGAMESGKSHLIRIALIGWCLEIPGLQCTLIRKKYDDIIKNHVEGPTGFRALLKPLIDAGICTLTREGIHFTELGSEIAFVHCQDERQFNSAQGVERHVLVVDEATQISERLLRIFRTWVRMPLEMRNSLSEAWRDRFPRILYTANPVGQSVPYFKRNFVDKLKNNIIVPYAGFKRQYAAARYTDNGSVDEEAHKGRVEGLGDASLGQALDAGDWNALTGEFFPEWDESRHVVPDFTPPQHWFRYRSFDWGTADPAAVYWIAVSDGEPFETNMFINGAWTTKRVWFPRGARIFYNEWYICDDGHSNPDFNRPEKGARLSNQQMAEGIIERSEYQFREVITLTDSKPFQDHGGDTIANQFRAHGVVLTHADTSRIPGCATMRGALKGVLHDPTTQLYLPMVYFCENCRYARDYIPAVPRHPTESKKEEYAESGEATHSVDAVRYGLHCHKVIKDFVLPTAEKIQRATDNLTARNTAKKLFWGSGV